jgi:hypothetical protein
MSVSSHSFPSVLQLPVPVIWRDMIDTALHTTMAEKYAERKLGAFGRCAEYAIVGARVLRLLLNLPYVAVGGSQIMACSDTEHILISPTRSERRHARNLSEMQFYHCWIQCEHAALGQASHIETIDFTVRYDTVTAELIGTPFKLPYPGDYHWGWGEEYDLPIPHSLRNNPALRGREHGWLWTDTVCLRLLRKYEKENEAYFAQTTSTVLHKIADQMERISTGIVQHQTESLVA